MLTKYTRSASASQIVPPKTLRDRQVALVFIVSALLITILWAFSPLRIRLQQQKELNALAREENRVQSENAGLRKDITNLKTSPDYIEWMARKNLGLIKSDEEAYMVIEPKHPRR